MKPDVSLISGVPVACLDVSGLLDRVLGWRTSESKHTLFYVNAHCMNLAHADPDYHHILTWADLVYADGISIVWASRILNGIRLVKMTGADWIADYCRLAERTDLRTYILAGKPGVAQLAANDLLKRYPGLKIVGMSAGYFEQSSGNRIIDNINASQAEVVFVGMGVPRQEIWIYQNRGSIAAPVCWAVGALFDYPARVEARVPAWLQRMNLEWFWRLLMDPSGKWKRYLLGNPAFMLRVLREKVGAL